MLLPSTGLNGTGLGQDSSEYCAFNYLVLVVKRMLGA